MISLQFTLIGYRLRRVEALSGNSDATLPKLEGKGCHGRGARNKRREMNYAGKAASRGRRNTPDYDKRGCCQHAGQIRHGRLNAGLAVATGGRFRGRLVAMEQVPEEYETEHRNGDQGPDWDPVPRAAVWMRDSHRTLQREPSAPIARTLARIVVMSQYSRIERCPLVKSGVRRDNPRKRADIAVSGTALELPPSRLRFLTNAGFDECYEPDAYSRSTVWNYST